MGMAASSPMPDAPHSPGERTPPSGSEPGAAQAKPGGWPLWLRIALAVVVLSFVWSPFLAMLMRLSRVNPGLQPTGGTPDLVPPAEAPPAPRQKAPQGSAGRPSSSSSAPASGR